MKNIIFSNNYEVIKRAFNRRGGLIKYFILEEVENIYKIENFLTSLPNCLRIEHSGLLDEKKKWYRDEYINFIAKLNHYNHSFSWWALELTTKMPLDSELCERAFRFLVITDLIEEKCEHLLIITDDVILVKQIKIYYNRLKILNAIKKKLYLRDMVKNYTPGFIFFAFLKMILFKLYSRIYYRASLNPNINYNVIRSLVSEKSFGKSGAYYDIFLGRLNYYLERKCIPTIIFATILGRYRHTLGKIRKNSLNINIIPQEHYLSFCQIIVCLMQALLKYYSNIKIKGDVKIADKEIGYLVKMAIREDYRTHEFFINLLSYYSTDSFLKRIKVNKLFYPFENRPWERMMLSAIRENRKDIKVIGYQHPAISLKNLNFTLGNNEHNILPLPDEIIASGEITKKIMEDMGHFPAQLLKIGCALRQEMLFNFSLNNRKKEIRNILVILTASINEYSQTLFFLNSAFSICQNDYKIYIRPHPLIPLAKARHIVSMLNFSFEIDQNINIYESLKMADLVLYVSSTAALEALAMGIPIVYLDLGDFINPDPLFNFSDFKWSVSQPKSLLTAIQSINNIPNDCFKILQDKARNYFLKYFYPVNENNLQAFVND